MARIVCVLWGIVLYYLFCSICIALYYLFCLCCCTWAMGAWIICYLSSHNSIVVLLELYLIVLFTLYCLYCCACLYCFIYIACLIVIIVLYCLHCLYCLFVLLWLIVVCGFVVLWSLWEFTVLLHYLQPETSWTCNSTSKIWCADQPRVLLLLSTVVWKGEIYAGAKATTIRENPVARIAC